jgi:hypothetical protein
MLSDGRWLCYGCNPIRFIRCSHSVLLFFLLIFSPTHLLADHFSADAYRIQGLSIDDSRHTQVTFHIDQHPNTPLDEQQMQSIVNGWLTQLSVAEDAVWVNLAPDEPDRIMPSDLKSTQLGYRLLEMDIALKQALAKYLSPDHPLGEQYWQALDGVSPDHENRTRLRVWITPRYAHVFDYGSQMLISEARLTVLSEQDYNRKSLSPETQGGLHIFHEHILSALSEDVNRDAVFDPLRRILETMITAQWYRSRFPDSQWSMARRLELAHPPHDGSSRLIHDLYAQYQSLFDQGEWNVVRELYSPRTQTMTTRHYVTGGIEGLTSAQVHIEADHQSFAQRRFELTRMTAEDRSYQLVKGPLIYAGLEETHPAQPLLLKLNQGEERQYVYLNLKDNVAAQAVFDPRWGDQDGAQLRLFNASGNSGLHMRIRHEDNVPLVFQNEDFNSGYPVTRSLKDELWHGSQFSFELAPRLSVEESYSIILNDVLFGSALSMRHHDRSLGGIDPDAKANLILFEGEGAHGMRPFPQLGMNDQGEIVRNKIVMFRQPRYIGAVEDTARYRVELQVSNGEWVLPEMDMEISLPDHELVIQRPSIPVENSLKTLPVSRVSLDDQVRKEHSVWFNNRWLSQYEAEKLVLALLNHGYEDYDDLIVEAEVDELLTRLSSAQGELNDGQRFINQLKTLKESLKHYDAMVVVSSQRSQIVVSHDLFQRIKAFAHTIVLSRIQPERPVRFDVSLMSDHKPLEHYKQLSDVFTDDVLVQVQSLESTTQKWFKNENWTDGQLADYARLVMAYQRHIERFGDAREFEGSNDIRELELVLLPEKSVFDIHPAKNIHRELVFLHYIDLRAIMTTAMFLFTQNAAPLAGGPYYLTPFGGDATIILEVLRPYLKPQAFNQQLLKLLDLVTDDGLLTHEFDTRPPSTHQLAKQSPRADVELMAVTFLMHALAYYEHRGLDFPFDQRVDDHSSVIEKIQLLVGYVLDLAYRLRVDDHGQVTGWIGPKGNDVRTSWRDATPSAAYTAFQSKPNRLLMVSALSELSQLSPKHWALLRPDRYRDKTLTDIQFLNQFWDESTKKHFQTEGMSREDYIENLIDWIFWQSVTNNDPSFVKALMHDAHEIWGFAQAPPEMFDRQDNQQETDDKRRQWQQFYDAVLPDHNWSFTLLGLDLDGNPVNLPNTDLMIFGPKFHPQMSFEELKNHLFWVVLPTFMGGHASSFGFALTNPMIAPRDHLNVIHPIEGDYDIPSTNLREIFAKRKNYHGLVHWPSMANIMINGVAEYLLGGLATRAVSETDAGMLYATLLLWEEELHRLGAFVNEETLTFDNTPEGRLFVTPFVDRGIASNFVQGWNTTNIAAQVALKKVHEIMAGQTVRLDGQTYSTQSLRTLILAGDGQRLIRQNVVDWLTRSAQRAELLTEGDHLPEAVGGIDLSWSAVTMPDGIDVLNEAERGPRWLPEAGVVPFRWEAVPVSLSEN